MKKNIVIILSIIFTAVFIVGCSKGIINSTIETGAIEKHATPFASEELLESIAKTDGFIHYKVARFFALNDLDDYRSENSWNDAWLSEYPLVIYNSETGNPRYYEFRVLKENREVGAISCAVDKTEGSPVQYVLPFVHEIGIQASRSVGNNTSKLVDRGYPGRLLTQQQYGSSFRSIDAVTDAEVLEEYPEDAKVLDVLLNATKEELKQLGIDSDEQYENYLALEQEKADQLAEFWQEVDGLTEKITSMTEDELQEAFNTESDFSRSVSTSYSNIYTLSEWVNKAEWYYYPIYCGPNVIAFTMLGLGRKSGYENIPTSDNNRQLVNYYKNIENTMGKGPKLIHWFGEDSLNGWLTYFTDGKYYLSTHWSIPSIVSHNWVPINASIRKNKLPVISLRLPKLENIKGGFHYRTIIGTREATTTLKQKVLWWTATINLWTKGQYLMNDNGADGSNWWEGESLYHFQAASVVKK